MTTMKEAPDKVAASMGAYRIWFVNALIACLIGASSYDIIRDSDHWPFSNYGMYSELQKSHTVSVLRLFGVTEGVVPHEFALMDFETLQPFDQARMSAALETMAAARNRRELLSAALRDSMSRYEMLRRTGRHNKPPLHAIKLYRLAWQLDSLARNVDRPDRKDLISEVGQNSIEAPAHD
jgi:hypothetical protein